MSFWDNNHHSQNKHKKYLILPRKKQLAQPNLKMISENIEAILIESAFENRHKTRKLAVPEENKVTGFDHECPLADQLDISHKNILEN